MIADQLNKVVRRVPAWPIYLIGAALPAWLLWLGTTGGLGVDPVKEIERTLGLWALKLIIAGLCISPLRRLAGINLIKYRRAIGVLAFSYVFLHFLTWIVLDMGLLVDQALKDIVKRPYITIGMAAMVLMLPLALTSNNWSVRKLGAQRWNKWHKLTYPAAILAALHYVWLVKVWPVEPFLYLGATLLLLGIRALSKRGQLPA
ncbi:Protein-methionine-sulfoxide reductase heme-binding subunit MsrQ [Defluviimonas aquaemixtae]|uniref:Protein-methionine-sulfoxide reductase heme-binding subunit MsrQ n=1 Tax=Albidovulum aquaemixtae TaxID=1542388 RepID=A0A2R8BKQ5_9RHOB|nr:protein-methionine-sulfoxide reductase heme-binding subunit MsrQ [Defluviimonas aquaemixtae]SPH23871.1 Protein-methionine-sulfoxide reductase heme-binding subunit MsrQ [Defluviimonas aquaemixtae]